MRVLTISEVYPSEDKPQYGVFVKQQMDELKKLGCQVDVLIPSRGGSNTAIRETICDGARIFSVGYRVVRYELFLKLVANEAYKQLKALIEKNEYDVLAVHITGDTILKIVVDIGRELGVAVVAHYHGLNVWKEYMSKHRVREEFYARRRARILKKVQGIVGVSDKVSDIIRDRIKNVPVYTVYNGVETTLFYPQDEKENLFTIVGVGNLIPIKGFRFLIEAFSMIYGERKDVCLKIIGDGIERAALEEEVKVKGLNEAVTFLGKIPYEEVAYEMRKSHLFVLPSYYEALGCVYLEAMACGIPTVGVKGMGIDEIINDGENGLLVEQQAVNSIYATIQAVLNDADFANKLGENGTKTAKRYTWSASAEKLDKIYKTVIAK